MSKFSTAQQLKPIKWGHCCQVKNRINTFTSSMGRTIIPVLELFSVAVWQSPMDSTIDAPWWCHYTCLALILRLKSTKPWPVCNPEAVTAAPSYKPVQPGMSETSFKRWEHNPIFENIDILYVDIPIDSQPTILGTMPKRYMGVAEVKLHSWTLPNFTGDELH